VDLKNNPRHQANPSTAPTSKNGTSGIRNRPASVNGQTSSIGRVTSGTSPASLRLGFLAARIRPMRTMVEATKAPAVARTPITLDRANTVATSTKGPPRASGIRRA
jgi:hypothetical protein